LESKPWGDDDRTPLFEHCPCCGVEFGHQDATLEGARRFRANWLAPGGVWDEPSTMPAGWSLELQLAHIPKAFR